MLTLHREVDAANAHDPAAYDFLRGYKQDQYTPPGVAERAEREVRRLLNDPATTRVGFWRAFNLAVVGLRDDDVAPQVQELFGHILRQVPGATLWSVPEHPWLTPRHSTIRTLFGVHHTPEPLLSRGERHMEAGWQLHENSGYIVGQYLDTLALALAPWLIGFPASRIGGACVLMFGHLEAGRDPDGAELIELYRPTLYAGALESVAVPLIRAGDGEAALQWWVERVGLLLTLTLDPANFCDASGWYDSAQHYATLLSLDRLFAATRSILIASRRDEFVRKTLLFESLDLLSGLTHRRDSFDHWASYRVVAETLAQLEADLPEGARRIFLPRCRVVSRSVV